MEEYFQLCGLVSRLTPIKTKDTKYQIDVAKLEQLFKAENLTYYKNVKENDFPRISRMAVYGYPLTLINLANYYRLSGKDNELKQLTELYKSKLRIGFNVEYEQMIMNELEK